MLLILGGVVGSGEVVGVGGVQVSASRVHLFAGSIVCVRAAAGAHTDAEVPRRIIGGHIKTINNARVERARRATPARNG